MGTIANPIATPAQTGTTGSSATPAATPSSVSGGLANEETFLRLLVSQLQNQDPLSPTDSNQFISQLTSYSQLEQLIGIHKDTTNLDSTTTSPAAGGSATTAMTAAAHAAGQVANAAETGPAGVLY